MSSLFTDIKAKVRAINHARLDKRHGHRAGTDLQRGAATSPATPPVDPYTQWVASFDTVDDAARAALTRRLANLSATPTIALLMPVYNSDLVWLQAAVDSVRAQIYPHWQLCIADDASPDPRIRPFLEELAASDPRIRVTFRASNGHISACSNSALELVDAPYVGLLDHDDVLREHALLLVAEALGHAPTAQVIYSDEDKLSPEGVRCDPFFKPDWNPELLLGLNYLCHFTVIDTAHLRARGGFRIGFEGSQDHDLVLRCTRGLGADQIVHIPHILYHWRQHGGSTAMADTDAKPYAEEARRKAVQEHLDACGIAAIAKIDLRGWCRLHWKRMNPQPLVSLIIPTRNGLDVLRVCIDSVLEKTTYGNYEILVVDNGSDDPHTLDYLRLLAERERVTVIRDDSPFNYSALNNRAAKLAQGEYLALVNNDIEVISPDWLHEMVAIAAQPEVGAVGARLWYGNKTLQHGGVVLGLGGVAGHAHKHFPEGDPGYTGRAMTLHAAGAVTAACLVVKKSAFEAVGGLDEASLAVAFNDVDFCLKLLSAGYRNVWTPYAELFHHESVSRGSDEAPAKRQRFALEVAVMKERWGSALAHDRMYSPNLTVDHENFSLAYPPRVNLYTPWFESLPVMPALTDLTGSSLYRTTIDLNNRNDSHTLIIEHVQAFADRPLRVLDVGCAGGDMGAAIRALGHHVTGIEPQASAAACAFHRLDAVFHGNLAQFLAAPPDEPFDLIVLADVLEHTANPETLLKQLKRCLSPDGGFVTSIPNITHASIVAMLLEGRWRYAPVGIMDTTHLRFFDRVSIDALIEDAGLEVVSRSTTTASAADVNSVFKMDLAAGSMAVAEGISTHPDRHVVQFIATCKPRNAGVSASH